MAEANKMMPARVFVGCAPGGDDAEAQAVFEYSVRRHSSVPIDLMWLIADTMPELSGWDRSRLGDSV
jgi:hypothetical protein